MEYTIDVLNPYCPSRKTLLLLSDKWVMLIILTLATGTQRHGELKRNLGNISQKMLTQTLRKLEHSNLVERIDYQEVPPKVEYRLTALGDSLREPICALGRWAEQHYDATIQ
ncbi:MAG: helix-turn-helix domain-containing protein [Deinococcota bacterium]